MRVYGLNGTGAAAVSVPVRRASSDTFSVGGETAPRAATRMDGRDGEEARASSGQQE